MADIRPWSIIVILEPGKAKLPRHGTALRAVGQGDAGLMLQFLKGSCTTANPMPCRPLATSFVMKQMAEAS